MYPRYRRTRRRREAADREAALGWLEASPDAAFVRAREGRELRPVNRSARQLVAAFGPEVARLARGAAGREVVVGSGDAERVLEVSAGGRAARLVLLRDVTALRRAERALAESERRHALVAFGANDGLWEWDLVANRMYLSARWKAMLGHAEEEVGASPNEWFIRVHPDDLERVQQRIETHLCGSDPNFEIEYRILHKDGGYLWVLTRGTTVRGADGEVLMMAGSQSDISERRDAQEQLVRKAFYDSLTGLPNRALFMDRLHVAVERARRHPRQGFAVLFVDVDRFKVVNDSLGHLVGDELLVQIARRLEKALRGTDTFARLGGDVFAIILDAAASADEARRVATRIKKELDRPFAIGEYTIHSSASIGIALAHRGCLSPEDLLREADTAMYRAKAKGAGQYQIYDAAAHSNELDLLHLENDLRSALERDEFVLHYQPIVSIGTGEVAGFEALLRWEHPTRGLVPPGAFIPVAEDTGLIVPIGAWVLREACRQMREWEERYPHLSGLSVSVNVSSRQFAQPGLVECVKKALAGASLGASRLKLEITESALVQDPAVAARLLERLTEMGVQLLIDDFGTGYSSLSYLHTFPIDALKIDRAFIARMGEANGKDLEIVRSTVSLAHNIGLAVIAEGVETEDQLERLRHLGCEFAQGWYYARALDAPGAEAMLASGLMARARVDAESHAVA
jgi:diguanylate cyclase (GGDEF)-like protein/PAS domain S-box-containing protein